MKMNLQKTNQKSEYFATMMEMDIEYNLESERTFDRPEGRFRVSRAFIEPEKDIVYFYGSVKRKKVFHRFRIEPGDTQAVIFGDLNILFTLPK